MSIGKWVGDLRIGGFRFGTPDAAVSEQEYQKRLEGLTDDELMHRIRHRAVRVARLLAQADDDVPEHLRRRVRATLKKLGLQVTENGANSGGFR